MKKINSFRSDGSVKDIFKFEKKTVLKRPLLGSEIPAGFPSPAQDYIEGTLDLNEFLISHPAATFFIKVGGYSMINAGIYPDDILIVDRAIEPQDKQIIIAVLDGDLTVKRLLIENGKWFLAPENDEYETIEITESSDFQVWGVVTYAIHKMK